MGPIGDRLDSHGSDSAYSPPAQQLRRLARVEPKLCFFGCMMPGVAHPGVAHAPAAREHLDEFCDGAAIRFPWPEVPPARKLCAVAGEGSRPGEIATEAIEDVLPRAHCLGVAKDDLASGLERRNRVRNELVGESSHLLRSRSRRVRWRSTPEGSRVRRAEKKIRGTRAQRVLRARLAVRVRVPAAQLVVLPVSPRPPLVLIALVGRDVDHRAGNFTRRSASSTCTVPMTLVEYVSTVLLYERNTRDCAAMWTTILGPSILDRGSECGQIPDVADRRLHPFRDARLFIETRLGGRVEARNQRPPSPACPARHRAKLP